jgi:hypothetical protein
MLLRFMDNPLQAGFHRHRRLLRPRRERPCGGAGKQRDELAPAHIGSQAKKTA